MIQRLALAAALAALLAATLDGAGAAAQTLSPAGQAAMEAQAKGPQPPTDLAGRRAMLDRVQQEFGARQQKTYAVDIKAATLAGVPVRLVSPKAPTPSTRNILLNLHGGGFDADSGSLTETIPIAALTGTPVVAVLYRLGPEHVAPAAVDDALAVYRELLKTHKPGEIGVYGTSAGAILGPQLMVRLRAEHLPLPAVGLGRGCLRRDRADGSTGGNGAPSSTADAKWSTCDLSVRPLSSTAGCGPALRRGRSSAREPGGLCRTCSRDSQRCFPRRPSGSGRSHPATSSSQHSPKAPPRPRCEGRRRGTKSCCRFDVCRHAFWAYIAAPETRATRPSRARGLGMVA